VNSNLHNRQWYALQIRPRFEKLAARHLNDKGYEGYLPVYTARRRWSDRMKSVEVPVIPGYTFCRFDIQAETSHSGLSWCVVDCWNRQNSHSRL
jgi:hypothetical protein